MNAVATFSHENGICGSDSDSNSDGTPEYYQPISTVNNGGEQEYEDEDGELSDQDQIHHFHRLPNGLSSLDLSDDEDEEEAAAASESERAIERAFREDERRRNAPLTAENAVRVMEAMRGISFGAVSPDWAAQIPEDQWTERLRRLRGPSATTSAPAASN
ncbi:Unknown protein [Striga hermonthica]|uniref:Uncharacterized protein n=1 Tax=Striga hermonthica TaxID=68872 RepID=A0A9N7P474_STRHE|nr:Unknown protein [Striga hermonthica]